MKCWLSRLNVASPTTGHHGSDAPHSQVSTGADEAAVAIRACPNVPFDASNALFDTSNAMFKASNPPFDVSNEPLDA